MAAGPCERRSLVLPAILGGVVPLLVLGALAVAPTARGTRGVGILAIAVMASVQLLVGIIVLAVRTRPPATAHGSARLQRLQRLSHGCGCSSPPARCCG